MLGKSWVIVNLKDGISWVYLKWLSQKVVGAGASQSHAITDFSETAISTTASNVVLDCKCEWHNGLSCE